MFISNTYILEKQNLSDSTSTRNSAKILTGPNLKISLNVKEFTKNITSSELQTNQCLFPEVTDHGDKLVAKICL